MAVIIDTKSLKWLYILQVTGARDSNVVSNHMFIKSRNALKTFLEWYVLYVS